MISLIAVLLLLGFIWAQCDADCDLVVTAADNLANNVIDGTSFAPGYKICFNGASGTFTKIVRLNNLSGASGNPILVTNCPGAAVFVDVPDNWGMNLENATYVHVTGAADDTIPYGFRVRAPYVGSYRASCFGVGGISSNFELDHIETLDCGFAGFSIKQDPKCDSTGYDRGVMPNYVNVIMHHNKASNTGGEGYYIGNSFYASGQPGCTSHLPHLIQGLRFFSNIAEHTDLEGAQFGCCNLDIWVYSNSFTDFGRTNEGSQNRGLQIGGGTTGHFIGNFLRKGPNVGIINHGLFDVTIANNIIVDTVGSAIASAEVGSVASYGYWRVHHNTIYGVTDGGGPYEGSISCVGGDDVELRVYNNLIGNYPTTGAHAGYGCTRIYGDNNGEEGNICDTDSSSLMFVDPAGGNFAVQAGSAARSGTFDVSSLTDLSVDYYWNLRNLTLPTAGAIEFGASRAPDGTPGLPPIETEPPVDNPDDDDDSSSNGGSSSAAASVSGFFF